MRFTTQKAALCHALLNGETLSIMDGFKKFGITNIPREVSRSIEKPFGVFVRRFSCQKKTRYGGVCNYTEYQLTPKNKKHSYIFSEESRRMQYEGIEKMKEYVNGHIRK